MDTASVLSSHSEVGSQRSRHTVANLNNKSPHSRSNYAAHLPNHKAAAIHINTDRSIN